MHMYLVAADVDVNLFFFIVVHALMHNVLCFKRLLTQQGLNVVSKLVFLYIAHCLPLLSSVGAIESAVPKEHATRSHFGTGGSKGFGERLSLVYAGLMYFSSNRCFLCCCSLIVIADLFGICHAVVLCGSKAIHNACCYHTKSYSCHAADGYALPLGSITLTIGGRLCSGLCTVLSFTDDCLVLGIHDCRVLKGLLMFFVCCKDTNWKVVFPNFWEHFPSNTLFL